MTQWLPPAVSTYGGEIDGIFMLILWITGIIFVVVEAALIYFVFKYRHKPDRKAHYIHGNWRVEVAWTIVPFILVIVIAAVSMGPWMRLRNPDRFPPVELAVEVMAKQFEWNVTYPGADGQLGTADDFRKRNQLHVPVGRAVHVTLGAEDVIHSFFLPEFRVKQDAVPGMTIPVWFEAMQPGEYVLGCAELCGLGHYRMRGRVFVLEQDEFDAWHAAGGQAVAGAQPATPTVVADVAHHSGH